MTTLDYFFVAVIIGVALYIFFQLNEVEDDDDWWGMA